MTGIPGVTVITRIPGDLGHRPREAADLSRRQEGPIGVLLETDTRMTGANKVMPMAAISKD